MFSGFKCNIVMMILDLINAINAEKSVTSVSERVHVGITYRLLIHEH